MGDNLGVPSFSNSRTPVQQKTRIGEIGPSQMFSPIQQEEIEFSRRIEKSVLKAKKQQRSKSNSDAKSGIFDNYGLKRKVEPVDQD